MRITLEWKGKNWEADLDKPIDLSIPLREGTEGVNCFFAPLFETSPVIAGDFIGSTREGGPLNFLNVRINPHGNGTHTECVGHIAKEIYTINQSLKKFFNFARLISVYPKKEPGGDRIIERRQLEEHLSEGEVDALLIRTLPNDSSKLIRNYSGTNPPFLSEEAASWLNETGIRHLLLDLPSVDREEDGGALAAHKAFWGYPEHVREDCTITELIYVPEHVPDGLYLLNIQIAGFEIDVSPSKPVLYAIKEL